MERLKVLVIGAGSVGTRHIRNLLALGTEVSAYRYRSDLRAALAKEFGIVTFESLNEALDARPHAVVVANRTDQHIDVCLAAAERGYHLYIEKPLSHSLRGARELERLVQERGLVVEIGCMLRFHPNLLTLKRLIADGELGPIYYARAFMGQYLPEWRPTQNYRLGYSAKREQGGGVLLDLIHEIDYLYWFFGRVQEVMAILEHLSDLETDAEDVVELLLRFEKGPVAHVHLDCVRPFYGRGCEIVGRDGILTWDYMAGTLTVRSRTSARRKIFRQPNTFERNTMFVDAMSHFLSRIAHGGEPAVTLSDGVQALRIVVAARQSSIDKTSVAPDTLCY